MRNVLAALLLCLAMPAIAHGPNHHEDGQANLTEEVAAPLHDGDPHVIEPEQPRDPSLAKAFTNLHPATVHVPIAFLLFAALAEFLSIYRGEARLRSAASVMAAIGGAGAVVAALFGWMHTGLWFGGGDTMQWHRWIGTTLGVSGPLIAWLALRHNASRTLLRVLLAFAAAAVLLQGWLGGEIAHGAGHLFA
ncbi:DUF2231 domain-containing protein [Aurantiacibacter sp. D1-12]|uniref:DUF2231 domain-containing protein n=1 Tax=Aurantiacibacter sp. D1-12 TaxID=2993658 RepID=UPI00237CCE86|nr:DUF2231 domain-containing protein [Aurantiacibacter sp. D1-12]MDE1468504.1 hypothetical protein [Aurantiacibacter sp. D1-12]